MPANPKDLYNHLRSVGELSDKITYSQFREQWDTPGWNVDFHAHLRQKQLVSLNYEDFVYTFGENDPNWDADKGIEISDEEIQAAQDAGGKVPADDQDPENLAQNFTGLPFKDGELVSSDGKVFDTPEDTAKYNQANKITKATPKAQQPSQATLDHLQNLYGNDLDAKVAEMNVDLAGRTEEVVAGIDNYIKELDKKSPKEGGPTPILWHPSGMVVNKDDGALALNYTLSAIANVPKQWEASWEGSKALGSAWAKNVFGADASDFIMDEDKGNTAFIDPVTNKQVSYKDNPTRYRELNTLNQAQDVDIPLVYEGTTTTVGAAADRYIVEKFHDVQKINETMYETGSIVKGAKTGSAVELYGGFVNALSSVAATAGPAMMTGGYSLAPQVIAPMWVDYNQTKADALYGDTKDPIAALVEADETEFAIPLALGAGALALEGIGFKGMTKYMAGNAAGKGIVNFSQKNLAWILTGNKEGVTEWLQTGVEGISQAKAQGKTFTQAMEVAAQKMFSEEGLEAYLQGMVGGMGMTAPSAAKRTLQRALHSDPNGHKLIQESISDIQALREARGKTKNKVTRQVIDRDIKAIEKRIKTALKDNNKLIEHMTDKENAQLRSIISRKDQIALDIQAVDKAVQDGEMTTKEGGFTKSRLVRENNRLSKDIGTLKENIDLSKVRSDVKMAQKLAKNLPNFKIQSFETVAEVRAAIEGARNEKGELYSKKELDDFANGSAGLFWEVDGVEYAVINEAKSVTNGLTATGQHEFLHKVLNRALKADPQLAFKMRGAVEETLDKLREGGFLNEKISLKTGKTRLQERLDVYKDQKQVIQAEELITILSEAIENGDIQITEKSKGFFGDVKELIRRSMLDMGVKSVSLEGEGAMQFIKDYNREYQRGKFSKATKKLMSGGKPNTLQRTGTAIKNILSGGVKQSLDSNEASFTWNEDTTGSFSTEPEMIGENEISLSIETGGNKALIENNPELGLDPNKPVHIISFMDENTEFDMTNSGDGLLVFGTVINNLKTKLDEIGAEQVIFSSVPEGNRQRLYTLMGATMAKKMGLTFEAKVLSERASYIPKGDKVFVLKKPAGGMKQAKVNEGDLYERTNKLYQEYADDKHTAGFLIGMEWENQIKKLARKYHKLPGYDVNIEDVVAYVMTANQGVPGLVNSYKVGKKTKDGKNEVSLEGYINKYLPNYINTALGKHGIGEAKDEGGFAVNIDDVKNVTSGNTAEDTLNLDDRKNTEIEEDTRRPQLKDAVGIENDPELKAGIEDKVVKNISASIKFFGKAKTRNEKIDAFIKETRKGIKNDEKATSEFMTYIQEVGVDNFLMDNKNAFLANTQRNDLQRNPLYKRVVQQRFKGVWKSREAVTVNGVTSYEYLKEDGTPYPPRHPDMDRDKMTETGTTAGHYKFRKVKNFDQVISTNEFVDFFYKDGKDRQKLNKVKLQALASQFSSEIGLELFAEQLQEGQGPIFEVLEKRVELTEKMTPDQVKEANEQKLIIREGMAAILTEKGIQETLKDLERGGIRQSKVNKTGFSWFDSPRIDMTNYLAGLENNDIRTGVVDGSIKSPAYTELYEDMKDAYDAYLGMQLHQEDWATNLQNYSQAFKDKDFANFDEFVDNTLGQVNNSVNGILGTNPKDTSLGKRNEVNKAITRKEAIDGYVNETLAALPVAERGAALADIINTLVGATSSNLYENTPGFYRDVVQPAIAKHKIKPSDFSLVEIEGGNTIHYKGKKITTEYAKGMYAEDTFGMFDVLVEGVPVISNSIDTASRVAEAKVAKKQYVDYLKWLNKNHKKMSPNTVAMIFKAFSNGNRSVAQTMLPLTKTMLVKQANEMASYTTVPSVPGKFINLASLKFVLTGKGLGSLNRIIDGASTAVLPKAYAKIVDQFHHNTPNNNFNSDKVNNKLNELDLPKIDLTDLTADQNISVIDVEGRAAVVKFNKTVEAVGQGMKFSKPTKGISVWDFDDTLAKTKSNILYTLPGQTRVYHGGEIRTTKDINGFVYFSEDQNQAAAYAAENTNGEVVSFMIEETSIATEDQVFAVIDELGITPQNGWAVDESHLYELIDPRFEQAFSKKDREKLATALKRKGIKAARFTDIDIAQGKDGGRETENIVVFNKKAVQPQNKINAAEFAAKSDQMTEEGASFDFSEFSKVVQGAKGPLFDTAVKRNQKFGNENVFILTARPQNSANAIHEFLKGIGLDIKIENITGLQDGSPQAKADWVKGKAAEGYNDFYFADDHISNVTAVKDVLNSIDVKSDVQQAGMKQSGVMNEEFNNMMGRDLNIEGLNKKKMRSGDAHLKGQQKDRSFKLKPRLFVPPSAEDFMGLLYTFAGKGKQGDADLKFFTDNLINPYIEGIERLDQMNTAINLEYKKLQTAHPEVVNKLHDKVEGTDYTYDMAIRYYLYERSGYGEMMADAVSPKIGLKLMKTILADKKMRAYADALSVASRQDSGYVEPDVKNWLTQSIATDFRRLITDAHRKNVLADFINNVDEIFSQETLNKIEAYYGTKFRKALFNKSDGKPGVIQRMISGRNAKSSNETVTSWINGAIAPIMFLNQRSGLLQMLSAGNFINWTDNNPIMVAKAIANPKQFFADMVFILKSPKMVQRRNGLRFSIEEAELANLGGAEGAWGVFSKRMIKLGFAPTQIFDALAIAVGGAPLYRNRINTYLKQGMSQQDAEAAAWKDFGKISDEAQQSSDQMLTSAEQSGGLGRIILAFSNTPAQYTRIMKKAALDIANGRGDLKTNLSKIAYYGFLQNLIFSSLQTALVASYGIFADDDEEERHDKYRKQIYDEVFAKAREPRKGGTKPKNSEIVAKQLAEEAVSKYNRAITKRIQEKKDRVTNGMLDTVLRGLGTRGAVIASVKNTLLEMLAQKDNREALKQAEDKNIVAIGALYEKVLEGSLTIDEAAEGEKLLNDVLLDIDPGTPLANSTKILLAALSISPPISAKARDLNKMYTNERFNKDVIAEKGWAWDSPRWMTVGLGLKTATNLPGDWIPKKIEVIKQITEGDGTTSQKAMMGLGWSPYDMGLVDNEFTQIKDDAKLKRKEKNADRSKAKRDLKKLKEDAAKTTLTPAQRKRIAAEAKRDRSAAGKKAAATRKANKRKKQVSTWEKAQENARLRRQNN